MKETLIENESITIVKENGILLIKFTASHLDLSRAKELCNYRLIASAGANYPVFTDIRNLINVNKEARFFLASKQGCGGINAAALLINSSINRMLSNFFLTINKPLVPTKLFTDEEEAKIWLRKYVNK